jgi:hypothetical protein
VHHLYSAQMRSSQHCFSRADHHVQRAAADTHCSSGTTVHSFGWHVVCPWWTSANDSMQLLARPMSAAAPTHCKGSMLAQYAKLTLSNHYSVHWHAILTCHPSPLVHWPAPCHGAAQSWCEWDGSQTLAALRQRMQALYWLNLNRRSCLRRCCCRHCLVMPQGGPEERSDSCKWCQRRQDASSAYVGPPHVEHVMLQAVRIRLLI